MASSPSDILSKLGYDLSDFGGTYDPATGRFVSNNGYSFDTSFNWYTPSGQPVDKQAVQSASAWTVPNLTSPGANSYIQGNIAAKQAAIQQYPGLGDALSQLNSATKKNNFLTHSVLPAAALFAGGLALAPAGAAAGAGAAGSSAAAPVASLGSTPFAGSVPAGAFGGTFAGSGGLSTAAGAAGGSLLPAGISGIAGPVGGAGAATSLLNNLKNASQNPGGNVLQTIQNIAPKVLGGASIIGGLLGSRNAQQGGSGGGAPPNISTASPPLTQYRPSPFLQTPGLGDYSRLAYSLMGQQPQEQALPNAPAIAPSPFGGSQLFPVSPGSGAYRPGFNQQLLQPSPYYGRDVVVNPTNRQIPVGLLNIPRAIA